MVNQLLYTIVILISISTHSNLYNICFNNQVNKRKQNWPSSCLMS